MNFATRSVSLLALAATSLLLPACGGDDPAAASSDATSKVLKEGTAEALAVLALVNDPAVTAAELTDGAKIDKRAATGIVTHRDGADGTATTGDDDAFDTVAELDAVKYVGETVLKKLLAYAKEHGYLKTGRSIEVVFSPQVAADSHNAKVAALIDTAQHSLDIAIYSYSDAGIQAALDRAVARGVDIRFIFETASTDKKLTGSALETSKSGRIEKAGINVRWVNKIMHHKFVLVDGPRDDAAAAKTAKIATGSANWSGSAATKYDENTLFLSGYPELALRLQREFNLLWEHSGDLVVDGTLPYELSTLAIGDGLITDEASSHVWFTSANFKVKGTTFSTLGTNEVADRWVSAIQGAKKSIHIASGHLRSRPVAEALMDKVKSSPNVEIRVYLDDQEYIGEAANDDQIADLDACLAAAGTSEPKKRDCLDKGFLYGLEAEKAGVDVRYKFYAYRWDASYAKQMHNKLMIVDAADLYTGSYNLSDNAEHQTFENMYYFGGGEHASLVKQYEERFAQLWETGRAEGKLEKLEQTIKTASTIPIVFDGMALTWDEATALKDLIRTECPAVDSTEYRQNAAAHQTCTK